MSNALKDFVAGEKQGRTASPQTVRTPGRTDEVKNNAGGYVFKVNDFDRLERFLILGTDGGTYYVGQSDLTKQNVNFLKKLIKSDERRVVDTIVDVSDNGRAYKNGPALFALALVFAEGVDKAYARAALPKVARTSTHLFEFASYVDGLGGWGRAKRNAIADWYTSQDAGRLAYQAVKYRGGRNDWTHRDLFRKSHPQGVDREVGNFILGKGTGVLDGPEILAGFSAIQNARTAKDAVAVLGIWKNLPWEAIPTQFLKDAEIWKTLFANNQLQGQALVRNITRLARVGAFNDLNFVAEVAERLTDEEMLAKTRLHPVNLLNAAVVYRDGQVDRRSGGWYSYGRNKSWDTNGTIEDALNDAFHASFKFVEPAGKRTLVATDISSSMSQNALGLDLSCAQVSAAVAMTIARTEKASVIKGFSHNFINLGITAKSNLATAMREVSNRNFGATDASLPMTWALKQGVEIDTFVVITDNETWAGRVKPVQALKTYRDKTGIPARLAVLGVASTEFTIADPNDKGMMDFVGFDANAPRALADFSAGRL
jgi:60 kDa SS-A/Ro ribonucleoprotein